jgi:hypothetical protein
MGRTPGIGWTSAVVTVLLFSLSTGGTLAGAQAPMAGSIHPHQSFVGTVNGLPADSAIRVLCPGPANSGHALSGQTLQVNQPGSTAANLGFTGSRVKAIVANLSAAAVTASLAKFTKYGLAASFPTSLTVPCSGNGVVSFDPTPGSPTARAYDVAVTFAGKAAAPQCTDGQIRIRADTDHDAYPPGHSVIMTSSIRNVSHSSCTIYLGVVPGWSPTFTVTNTGGMVVWDRCWVNDQPGACATLLRSHTLHPGQRYQQEATWDQRSGADGQSPRQVPQGLYTFSTHFRYMTGTASATFDIVIG